MGTYWLLRHRGKFVGGIKHPSKDTRDIRAIQLQPSEFLNDLIVERRQEHLAMLPPIDWSCTDVQAVSSAAACTADTVTAIWQHIVVPEMNEYEFTALFDITDRMLEKWAALARVRLRQAFVPLVSKKAFDEQKKAETSRRLLEMVERSLNHAKSQDELAAEDTSAAGTTPNLSVPEP